MDFGPMTGAPRFDKCGPHYAWRWISHPYAAALFLSVLLIVPYSFPFTMPVLFPPYTHFATLEQHLTVSIFISLLILAGVTAGLWSPGKLRDQKRLADTQFLASNDAIFLFGFLLVLSWILMIIITPMAFAALQSGGARAARESMKTLGGISFLSRMSSVCLLPLLIGLRLRGRSGLPFIVITAILTLAQSAATTERFQVVQFFLILIIYIALYRPQSIKLSSFLLILCAVGAFLAANLAQRAFTPVPPALRAQFEKKLPEIALGTFLTYPSDTMNKLYFQMFQSRYDRGAKSPSYLIIPNALFGRLGLQFGQPQSDGVVNYGTYVAGKSSSLDFLNGRNPMMTNGGGPTQDYQDFGLLAPLMLFLKFFVFARIYLGARRLDPLCVALLPSFFAAAIVYTQENMLYEVGSGMPVLMICVLIPIIRHLLAGRFPAQSVAA
jgi:hypothetical protein